MNLKEIIRLLTVSADDQASRKCIIVLGMHRSGTSCLAGILQKAGVALGNVSSSNPYNLRGNKENMEIMDLHNELLKYNGGTWDSPPNKVLWPKHLKKKRDAIISDYKHSVTWGFKDPRTLFTLDGWLEVLTDVSFAGTFRHPAFVARSLMARNKKFTYDKCLLIWKMYNERLLFYHEKVNFPVISFDLKKTEYKKKAIGLLSALNLHGDVSSLEFFDDSLRHHRKISDLEIPIEIMHIYGRLQSIAL